MGLDISIKSGDKHLTQKNLDEFLSSNLKVYQKVDGVKINAVKVSDTGENDWIISYKGNVLYDGEFNYLDYEQIKNESIGVSQYRFVLDYFNSLGKTTIPVGTELFLEYLIRKPTLSNSYKKLHQLVLIGYSNSQISVEFGKSSIISGPFLTENRESIADELKLDIPCLLFDGYLSNFEESTKSDELLKLFKSRKIDLNNIEEIKKLFLDVPSKYGGKEEGVVIYYNDSVIKFQQEYQTDQKARSLIKSKYICSNKEDEEKYWENVKDVSLTLAKKLEGNNKLETKLKHLSSELKSLNLDFTHEKKSKSMILDDIQLTTKTLLIKGLKGNNNCLIIGKFRVLTNGHAKMIKQAIEEFDNVTVCVISNKETKNTLELRKQMLLETFPSVKIIEHSSANLFSILNKCPMNINSVYTGTDRLDDYTRQMSKSFISVLEIPRNFEDISATKVIGNIQDKDFFEKNTPKEIHYLYNLLIKTYNQYGLPS